MSNNLNHTPRALPEVLEVFDQQLRSIRDLLDEGSTQDSEAIKADLSRALKKMLDVFIAENNTQAKKEKREYSTWQKKLTAWRDYNSVLFDRLRELADKISQNLGLLKKDDEFSKAPVPVQERLKNRKESLIIISNMFRRLLDREMAFQQTEQEHQNKKKNPRFLKGKCKESVALEDAVSFAEKEVEKFKQKYEEKRNINYLAIRNRRLAAEKLERDTQEFIKNYLLSAIDGIERGINDENELMAPLTEYQEFKGLIECWFKVHHLCMENVENFLPTIKVEKIGVKVGDEFNPAIHMPLMTQSSDVFHNNQVLGVIRSGYLLFGRVLRPAEVVVVRNQGGE